MLDVNSGESTVFVTTDCPLERICSGSNVLFLPLTVTIIFTGMTYTGMYTAELLDGAAPTMLYQYVFPLWTKEPFHVRSESVDACGMICSE
jgi:hypothetical protein